jgi:hypothetical protein
LRPTAQKPAELTFDPILAPDALGTGAKTREGQAELCRPPFGATATADGVPQRLAFGSLEFDSERPNSAATQELAELPADAVIRPANWVAGLAFHVGDTEATRPMTGAPQLGNRVAQNLAPGALEVTIRRPLVAANQKLAQLTLDALISPALQLPSRAGHQANESWAAQSVGKALAHLSGRSA